MTIRENGPWRAGWMDDKAAIWSEDFTHDVVLYVSGDFESDAQRGEYATEIARRLNAATTKGE